MANLGEMILVQASLRTEMPQCCSANGGRRPGLLYLVVSKPLFEDSHTNLKRTVPLEKLPVE